MARRGASGDPKVAALREARCLNPHPEQVTDEAFGSQEFFDARDAVQVKYEMVRRVRVDGDSVTAAAAAFGYSRPSYYEAAAALDESGPGRAGAGQARAARRAQAHRRDVLAWAEQALAADPGLRPAELVGTRSRHASACACTPARSSARWPAAGSALQKPLTCPPTSPGRRTPAPVPDDPHLAMRLLNRAPSSDAGQDRAASRSRAGRPLRTAASCRPARARRGVPARLRACSPARASPPGSAPSTQPGPTPQRDPPSCPPRRRHQPRSAAADAAGPGGRRARQRPGRRRARRHLTRTHSMPAVRTTPSMAAASAGRSVPVFTDTAASKVTAAHLSQNGAVLCPPVHPQAGHPQHRVRASASTTCAAGRSRWAGPPTRSP